MGTLIIVRRDAAATFAVLQSTWQHALGGEVELLWDRRAGDRRRPQASVPAERRAKERRTPAYEAVPFEERHGERRQRPEWRPPERRQVERRRPPPDTWGALGFVLVRHDRPAAR